MMVLSKYIFCISIYVICCVIYAAETLIIPELGTTNMNVFSLMLLVTSVFIGIYLPVQYKLGYEKTKFTFFVLLMASPIILPWLIKVLSGVDLSFLTSYSPLLIFMAALAASCIILLLSVILSVKFYSDTDLA